MIHVHFSDCMLCISQKFEGYYLFVCLLVYYRVLKKKREEDCPQSPAAGYKMAGCVAKGTNQEQWGRRPEWHGVEILEKRKQNEFAFISSFGLGLWVSLVFLRVKTSP